jgi:hypothetical protein
MRWADGAGRVRPGRAKRVALRVSALPGRESARTLAA